MTQIHISIRKPKTGGLDPVTGTLRFRPVRRHFDAAKNLIIAALFDANLSESGELTVDLLPTTGAFVWQVIELADTPQAYTRYVEVPNSKTKVEYADLVEVDAGTFVPKDMGGVAVKMRPPVGSLAEAETESDNYPGYLVWYPEGVSTAKAREILESLEQLQADAQTSAATTFALKSQVVQDAGMVSDAATAAASSVTADADAARQSIRSKQTEATAAIDKAVQSVQDKAKSSVENIQQAEDDAKNDAGTHDGAESGTQTGEGSTTGNTTDNVTDADSEPVEE